MSNFLSISNERGHFDYPSLSQDFEWKPYVEIALIYQVLTKQCLKKVFPTSNDFVPNGSSLLNGRLSCVPSFVHFVFVCTHKCTP